MRFILTTHQIHADEPGEVDHAFAVFAVTEQLTPPERKAKPVSARIQAGGGHLTVVWSAP